MAGAGDTLVLCYHAVSPAWDADLSVTPDAFAAQMRRLAASGYRGVTFAEAARPGPGRRVAVTFDDAFTSVATLGKPVLDALGWPGTVFAVADHVRDGTPLAWQGTDQWLRTEHASELAGLDARGLRALARDGWEIGSHTCTHPHLTACAPDALRDELERSRADLAAAVGVPITTLAYPYGDHDDAVVAATEAAGYELACILSGRVTAPLPLRYPRVGLYHPDDQRRFRVKVSPVVRAARLRLGR